MSAPRPSRFACSNAWLIFKAGMVLLVVDGMVFPYLFCLYTKRRVLCIEYTRNKCAAGVCFEQREQVLQGGFNISMSVSMVRFDGDDGTGGIGLGRALFALSPAPAAGHDQPRVVAEHNLAHFGVIDGVLSERGIAFAATGEMHGQRTIDGAGIEDGGGQRVADADQVAEIDQRVDGWDVALFREAAQQAFGGGTILCWLDAKGTKSAAPCRQRWQLTERRVSDALQRCLLFCLKRGLQLRWRRAVRHVPRVDHAAHDRWVAGDDFGVVLEKNHGLLL